jgi:hypothetical protein
MKPDSFLLALTVILLTEACSETWQARVPKWGVYESHITSATGYDDPIRDVDLILRVTRPDGTSFSHYGFYAGGNKWIFRVMPDMEGEWQYVVAFSDSSKTASGKFLCKKSDKAGPLTVYEENPLWSVHKDSPNKQIRSFHTGDRFFASNFSAADRKRFLDWIEKRGYNLLSVASHYLNRQQEGRGKGWETPRLWPLNPGEYGKLESIMADLEKRNIYVYPFAGFFGRAAEWPTSAEDQELYIKYTLARLASFRNIILNVAGPEPLYLPEDYQNGNMRKEDIGRIALLIKKYDPYGHILSVHNKTNNKENKPEMDPFIFEEWEDYATLQGAKSKNYQNIYDFIISSRKVIKPAFAQEVLWYGNMYHTGLDTGSVRKKAITLLMAGAFINFGDMNGNSSSGFSGSLDPDSANSEIHDILHNVWDIFDSLPFEDLAPAPWLAEGAFCLSDGKAKTLFYSPDGKPFRINIPVPLRGQWINPRSKQRITADIAGNNSGKATPPDTNDWLLFVEESQAEAETRLPESIPEGCNPDEGMENGLIYIARVSTKGITNYSR